MSKTGYRLVAAALDHFRAAGLYLPCDSEPSRRRLQQVWLERYCSIDADLFIECVKILAAGSHFPRLFDMDAILAEVQLKRSRKARAAAVADAEAARPVYDMENSRRRIRQLIDHLQQRYTVHDTHHL